MAPVIRITDQVFRRLQRLGEPLVDTPSTVIERVLEHYERSHPLPGVTNELATSSMSGFSKDRHDPPEQSRDPNLFLVPARNANLEATIKKTVPLQVARECLSDEEFSALAKAVAPAQDFRCWATTEANSNLFSKMRPGDLVLITEKSTGRFNYRARIVTKVVSEALAERLWSVVPGLPWKLIYILDEVRPLNVPKKRLVAELGYAPTFWVPGHIRVDPSQLQQAVDKHGSIEKLLKETESNTRG